jgi:hypothetical protein
MHEIICPHCHKAFKIDEAGYADILKQVRDGDFEKQLHERLELAEREKRDAIALAEANVTNALQKTAAAKDAEIQALKAQLDAGEVARKLAVTEALGAVSQERDALANELKAEQERARNSSQAAAQLAEAKLAHALQAEAAKKDAEIQALQAKLEATETARQLAVNEAVGVVARQRDDLKNDLNLIAEKTSWKRKPSRSNSPCSCATVMARLRACALSSHFAWLKRPLTVAHGMSLRPRALSGKQPMSYLTSRTLLCSWQRTGWQL